MIIYFDPKTYQFLNTYSFKHIKDRNIELEARFGEYKDGKFKPDIGLETFDKLTQFLSSNGVSSNGVSSNVVSPSNKPLINNIVKEESKSEILPNHIRRIIYSDNPTNDPKVRGKVKYEQKNKLFTTDIEYNDFIIRLAESEEVSLPSLPEYADQAPIEIRERNRTMYFHNSNAFYYVLTEVKTNSNGNVNTTYELEIEYNVRAELVRYFSDMMTDSIALILPFLINNYKDPISSYIPTDEQRRIRDLYNSLYIKEPKPVNLSRQETPELQSKGYSVTNKLDGERFILLFTNSGFYAFNNRKVEKYNTLNYQRFLVMDSEFFEGRYYIFDCMMYNGEKVTEEPHDFRLKMAQEAVKTFSFKNDFLILKTFYRGDEKDSLKNNTKYLLDRLSMEKNDGIIYTSSGRYNTPIYKWKFPEKMSIDFAVYKIGLKDETKYELYVKDNIDGEPVNVPFRGNSSYELKEAVYITESGHELKEGGIYEFGYDNTTEKFILFRPRLDKIDPNFITVAENVWNDIKNPYTKDELIQLLSPKVLEEYRKYQNNIKRSLIEEYCKDKAVLDLGSGRGGDLGKYDGAKVSHLWCVEPNPKNYTELLRRLKERRDMKRKTTLIKTVAQDTDEILKSINDTVCYTYPVVFQSNVLYGDTSEIVSYTSVDNLRSQVSYGYDIDRNNFIIIGSNGLLITDEELYIGPENNDHNKENIKELKVVLSSEIQNFDQLIKRQELGGDFKNWFPKKHGVDYEKLKITDEGMYSLTKQSDSLAIIKAMENIIGEDNIRGLTILDGTANVGGDTIRFGMNFNKVISVELNLQNFEVLKNNVEVYNLKDKTEIINGDITKVWNDVQLFTDVLFLDPPWGGKDYIERRVGSSDEEEVLNLFLSGMTISEFVGRVLLSPNKPSYVFLKLPVNYDINSFKNMPYVSDMQVFTIRKFYLLCLTIDKRETPIKKADILSSFFSLSFFFFKDERGEYSDLNNLIETIDKTIKNDGYFIGTTIDGNSTKKLLNSSPDRKFNFDGGYIRFMDEKEDKDEIFSSQSDSRASRIELLIRDTIVETQVESLVDFELLQAKLLERDIILYKSEIFEPSDKLTESENILNSLYRYFVFKKKSKKNIYHEKVASLIEERARPIVQTVKKGKNLLSENDIIKTLSLGSLGSKKLKEECTNKFVELLDLKKNLVGDYNLLYFNYGQSNNKQRPSYLITKYYENPISYLKEYYRSNFYNVPNMLKVSGLIDDSTIYKVKDNTNLMLFKEVFKMGIKDNKILSSCIYQLYFSMKLFEKRNIYLSNPQIILVKDKEITSIRYGNIKDIGDIEVQVFGGIIVKILNYSYSIDKDISYISSYVPKNPPKVYDYSGIEILYYLDKNYKVEFLSNIDTDNTLYSNFLLNFLTIQNSYTNIEDNEVNINTININGNKEVHIEHDLFIKEALDIREEKINELTETQYEYYDKLTSIFKNVDFERSKNKVSTKITKWMEVLSRYMIYTDKEKKYNVLSNGYMPQMFLYALRSITDIDFDWYINDEKDENKELKWSKCKNWMHVDTTDKDGINYIEKKMNKNIHIYASYLNKDLVEDKEQQKEKFLSDILTGLVSLKQDGLLLINIKSFFTSFEINLLGYVSDMFKEFYIYKPLSSDILLPEVFIVGVGYKRDEEKIKNIKDIKGDIRNIKISQSKYSNILLAAYKFYGRQMYFMDKNMECYKECYENIKDIKELNEDLLRKSGKMVIYYLKIRKTIQKGINKIIESFNFNVKKWDNYGCLRSKKLKELKLRKE